MRIVPPRLGVCCCWASAVAAPHSASAAASQTSLRMLFPFLDILAAGHSIVPDPFVQGECRHATLSRRSHIGTVPPICRRVVSMLARLALRRNADEHAAELSPGR